MPMTQGQQMVWAAAYAQALELKTDPETLARENNEAAAAALAGLVVQGMSRALNFLAEIKTSERKVMLPMLREMLGLPVLDSLPPLPDGFPPAPDYSSPPPGYAGLGAGVSEAHHAEHQAEAWAKYKLEHDPAGYAVSSGKSLPIPLHHVFVTLNSGEARMLAIFKSPADARAAAWACAERPHHVAFVLANRLLDDIDVRGVLDWTEQQLVEAHNYIAARRASYAQAPIKPAFFPLPSQ